MRWTLNNQLLTLDQRGTGFPRIVGATGNVTVDAGAFEANAAPTITATSAITRQQGSPAASASIATVADTEDLATALTVAATPATGTGVSISSIGVDSSGNVTATVGASCSATTPATTFTLRVTDSGALFAETLFTVNVSANTAPTLGTYATTTVALGASSTLVTPGAAPGDNGSVNVIGASAPGFTGTLTVDLTTGVVTVENAAPAGGYTVTVTATDNCGSQTSGTFTLNVQVAVPNVVGLTQAAATTAITGAGLVVGTVTTAASSTVPAGNVISESPAASTLVNVGSAVNLVVSTGPAQVAVPNVVGQTQAAATTAIQGAGLVVGTVTTAASSTVPTGSVISENPAAGTQVNGGSTVNLVVSTGPPTQIGGVSALSPPDKTAIKRGPRSR